nr:MAG: hypothetical protein TU35_08480 [Thermoproteus sp. AZ2]
MQAAEVRQLARRVQRLGQAIAVASSVAGLVLFFVPALLDHLLGGVLEPALPASVYNAIHELRHLLGIPCH